MKKFGKLLLITLGAASVITAAGCAAPSNVSVTTNSNWYVRTGYGGIQPTSVMGEEGFSAEVLKYDIELFEGSANNDVYKVEYDQTSSYTTEFYGINFDWQSEEVLQKYKTDKTEKLYVFKTELNLVGRYTHADGGVVEFDDTTTSVCYFRSAENNLKPVYSYQEVHSTSPVALSPESKDDMAKKYDYSYTVNYDYNLTEATVTYADLQAEATPTEKVVEDLDRTGYSLFDNASVLIAMRAMNTNSEGFSKTVSMFIPVDGGVKNYTIARNAGGKLGETDTKVKNALVAAGYCDASTEVNYNVVNATLLADMQGATQSAVYASVSDEDLNNCRSTLLEYYAPLSYGLGTIYYSLNSVDSVLGTTN